MKQDKLMAIMAGASIDDMRSAYIHAVLEAKDRRESARSWIESRGWVRVSVDASDIIHAPDADYLPDGRVVMQAQGAMWAIAADVFAERRDAAIKAAQDQAQSRAIQHEVTEAIAATTCPQMIEGKPCGGSLNRKGVCPSCVTGKMGYRYRYTCESCGCDIVTREELR